MPSPRELLARPLLPRRPQAGVLQKGWPKESVANVLAKADETPAFWTIADHVANGDPALAQAKYDVAAQLRSMRWRLDTSARAMLEGRDAIRD